ncbi:MAG TPA: tRNA pseudouridine(55) synthase TruB [Acidobacteriaceae bacterium]|nr:tRNA pseudouridine(55) synthase TruB [Acidobacteriaceae bacterium]
MNGLLILDKPQGITSHDVVARVRKLTGERSIGHLGTLDPMATGVLPLLLGKFTRLAQFFQQDGKRYTGTIRFGFATDTYDVEGKMTGAAVAPSLTMDVICETARGFLGTIDQTPPPYSAKKINGTPAYKLARAGAAVVLRPVTIEVRRLDILSYQAPIVSFDIEVSSGGYIRSIAHDLGQQLRCGAHLTSLRRVQAGEMTLQHAVTLEELAAWASAGTIQDNCPHPRTLLPHMPAVTVDEITAGRIRNGMACNLPEFSQAPLVKIFTSQRDLLAIGRRVAGTLIQPMVVLG